MEPKTTHSLLQCINYRRLCLLCFFFSFSILVAGATEYIIFPAPGRQVEATEYIVEPVPGDQVGVSVNGEKVVKLEDTVIPYWQFLLWLAAMQILSIFDVVLYFINPIFAILGFKIVNKENVLGNTNRSSIYTYIKTKPGACIGEIVEKTGFSRGRVRHHITILKAQNKIEVHKDSGKIRYFENNSTYDDEKRKIITALQNVTSQRIISEVQNGICNTNSTLAHKIGVSRSTISWHVRTLKEAGLINEKRKGKGIIYIINRSYENLIEKYG